MNIFSPTKIIFLIFVTTFAASAVFAQTPIAAPPKDDGEVVKISTTLIQVDATVTDKKAIS